MNELHLCMGCMNELEADGTCSFCGYSDKKPHHPFYLPPETNLNNRYLVGKLISYNGESAVYIGYDTLLSKKVFVREFAPDSLSKRNENKLVPDPESLVKYKNYQIEFVELYKSLMKMKSLTHLINVYDIVYENNTAYSVYDYYDGITLEEYIKRSGNILNWNDLKKLLPPVLTTLSLLHNSGRRHLGISPESIWITTKGDIKIDGLCIEEERISNSGLVPELYSGYSAPEQYISHGTLGNWTDVYSVCAVIFRALSGVEPSESVVRFVNDPIEDLSRTNPSVPADISAIIKKGMAVSKQNRINNITELVSLLFSQPKYEKMSDEKKVIAKSAVSHKSNTKPKKKILSSIFSDNRFKMPLAVGLTTVVVLGIILGAVMLFVPRSKGVYDDSAVNATEYDTESVEETMPVTTALPQSDDTLSLKSNNALFGADSIDADGETVKMPDLIGIDYDSILKNEKIKSVITIQPVYEYNDTVAKGCIIKQSMREDTVLAKGTTVTVTVSKGPSTVTVPEYTGLLAKDYVVILDSYNIKYSLERMDTYEFASGYVVRTSKPIGDKIDLLKNETLIVYVANNLLE